MARALYGDPVIVVLDERNSSLDHVGSEALNTAIRNLKQENRSVLIIAHRPAAIQECDPLMVLESGTRTAFGPKEEVLKRTVEYYKNITLVPTFAGGIT